MTSPVPSRLARDRFVIAGRQRIQTQGTLPCLVGVFCLALLIAGSSAISARQAANPLRPLNERWAGAECTIRFEVPIKKGQDKNGWSGSIWIVPGTQIDKDQPGAKLFVSNRDRLPGGRVYPGTSFVAEGWSFEDPKD